MVVFIEKKQTRARGREREREKETAMIRDGANDVTSHKERREITIAYSRGVSLFTYRRMLWFESVRGT